MALHEIPYGGEINSQPLNENFKYLNQKIVSHEADMTAHGVNTKVSKVGDSMTGVLRFGTLAINKASFYKSQTLTYGIKIITDISAQQGQFSVIKIEGGHVRNMISLQCGIHSTSTLNHLSIKNNGNYEKPIKIASENGKIVLFVETKDSYVYIESSNMYTNQSLDRWVIEDAPLSESASHIAQGVYV